MTADGDNEPVNILLVDDRPGNLLSLQGILERPDYNLVLASSGAEALRLVLRYEFAAILLDIAMPEMDGFEVASTLKQRERYRAIPILFVTASVEQIDWVYRAYSAGAVDILHKPLDAHAVRAKVGVFVALHRQGKRIQRQAARLAQTEREQAIAAMKEKHERRMRNLAEAIPHIVWTTTADGEVDYVNSRWREATGLDEARALGDGWRETVHADDAAALAATWRGALADGRAFQHECRLRQRDGSFHWYLCRGVREPDGGARWIGTFTDVDDQKRAEGELAAAIRLRDEFLSVASHELRTPLSALQLQLQSAERRLAGVPNAERLQPKIRAAVRQTERLGTLVDTLLDVSRIAAGRLQLQLAWFDAVEAARDVVERLAEQSAKAGCEVTLAVEPPLVVRWDRLRFEQVLTNLLINATKYAAGAPIDVALAGDGDEVQVAVRDHGIGIDPGDAERIFERFERAVSSMNYGGLGLGLYIARQIVEAHGGSIEVESRPGQGSTFRLRLPRDAAAEEPRAREHA